MGLPIGNITSQIFANIYLNELDQFVKNKLNVKCYFRYADDFVILHHNPGYLKAKLLYIDDFLKYHLSLQLHPGKVEIRKFSQGVDFLGYVILPHRIVLRTKTKQRMFRKLRQKMLELDAGLITSENFNQILQSYLGILKQGNNYELANQARNLVGYYGH